MAASTSPLNLTRSLSSRTWGVSAASSASASALPSSSTSTTGRGATAAARQLVPAARFASVRDHDAATTTTRTSFGSRAVYTAEDRGRSQQPDEIGALRGQILSKPHSTARATAAAAVLSAHHQHRRLGADSPRNSSRGRLAGQQVNMSTTAQLRSLNINNINPHVKEAKYAVRGALAIRSEEYRDRLRKGDKSLPFDQVISANIGNPQQLDQKPITFFRQVLSLVENPALLEKEDALTKHMGYPSDVVERAKWLLKQVGSVGAYSASGGATGIRESVARFIEARDGYPADPKHIYLCAGASSGVNTLLHVICASPKTGLLIPIPQYPLYTASLSVLNARCVPYYLDESSKWGTDLTAIKQAYDKAVAEGTDVRAIVVINPGNPTGGNLSKQDIKAVIDFAAEKKLVIMADEVYQTNIFEGKFHSFKAVLGDMQHSETEKYKHVELASLNSCSKGMVGECGHRGGYFELVGFDSEVEEQIYKFISISLCAPVVGQCLVELVVNPPKEGQPSYDLYKKEYDGIHQGLRERATALYEAFQSMEGVECQLPQASMYLFPTIHLPPKALEAAKKENISPDEFYAFRLLDATGICIVPGAGFGQKEGTLHFRTTFLAPGTEWVGRITKFHKEFMDEFRS